MARKPGSPPLWFLIAVFAGMAIAAALLALAFQSEQEKLDQPIVADLA